MEHDDLLILKALCERRLSSILVPLRGVRFSNGEEPGYNVCHLNVARWVKENRECTPVRGWLDSGGILDAHSVVADAYGTLFDITPLQLPGLRFVRHLGTENEFWALVKCPGQVNCVLYS
jgi:hypothetical protein